MTRTKLVSLLAVASAAFACGSDPKPPPAAPGGATDQPAAAPVAAEAAPPAADKSPNKATLNISEEIRKACGIEATDAHFGFDSSNIRASDHAVLDKLAKCFISGPLAGRKMRLVGHADPRGSEEYNLALGGDRAENVKKFVATKGLSGDRMETSSRGEMEATGTDEASWFRDRRVDIMLAD